MSEPYFDRYDIWRLRTPMEYEPERVVSDGPDPDALREEEIDRRVERDRAAGTGELDEDLGD